MSLTLKSHAAVELGEGGRVEELSISTPLTASADPPLLEIDATLAGKKGLAPGVYALSKADADPLGCSLCVTVVGPLSEKTERPAYTYAASGGILTVRELGTRVRGQLVGAKLRQVQYNAHSKRYEDRGGACQASIAKVDFDLPLERFAQR